MHDRYLMPVCEQTTTPLLFVAASSSESGMANKHAHYLLDTACSHFTVLDDSA